MADIKISQLGSAIAVGDTDVLPIVSGGNTLKATAAQVKEHSVGNTNISGIGDGSVTGAISSLNSGKQPKTLDTPLTIGGVSKTTVEDALGGLVSENQTLTNNKADSTEVNTINNFYGAKNLLPNYGKSQNINGVQIIVASDGSYTMEGTNSGSYADFELIPTGKGGFTLPAGTYKLSGIFATQSGATTGNIAIEYTDNTSDYLTGESTTFTLSAPKTVKKVRHSIGGGYTLHTQVYPMLRLASIADDTYVPYSETNKQLTDATVFEEGTPTINTTNFTDYGSWVAKFGKLIFLYVCGKIEFATTGSNVELMTLPSDFKPTKSTSILAAINDNNVGTLSVNTNGRVDLYLANSAQGWTLRGVLIAIK